MVDEYGICKISDFKMSYRLSADDDYEVQVKLILLKRILFLLKILYLVLNNSKKKGFYLTLLNLQN